MTRRTDERAVRRALKRLRRYAENYKWDGMGPDIVIADRALEALDRIIGRLEASIPAEQPRLKGLGDADG